jgi:putative tricarboxylic transport membrane protein
MQHVERRQLDSLLVRIVYGDAFLRALFAGILGLMASTIGTSLASGMPRGTFGLIELEDGLPIILCVIGMFAIPEMIALTTRTAIATGAASKEHVFKRLLTGVKQALGRKWILLRSSAIGIGIGVLPAAGATLASLLSYSVTKRHAKPGQKFGEGEPDGVIAAESANNASEGGAMAIMLSMGIPGSASTAVILGGFMLHGLIPGPGLFRGNGPLVYGLIVANILQMAVLGLFALAIALGVARVVRVPTQLLLPVLVVLISVGAFSLRNLWFDVVILFAFGFIGYLLRRFKFAPIAFMVGLFLGRPLDEEMVRFNVMFGDDLASVMDRPITVGLVVLTLLSVAFQIRRVIRDARVA